MNKTRDASKFLDLGDIIVNKGRYGVVTGWSDNTYCLEIQPFRAGQTYSVAQRWNENDEVEFRDLESFGEAISIEKASAEEQAMLYELSQNPLYDASIDVALPFLPGDQVVVEGSGFFRVEEVQLLGSRQLIVANLSPLLFGPKPMTIHYSAERQVFCWVPEGEERWGPSDLQVRALTVREIELMEKLNMA